MNDAKKHAVALAAASLFCLFLHTAPMAATGAAAVGENDAFALGALDRMLDRWTPPAGLGQARVSIRVSLDGEGRLLGCRPVRASSSEALDRSACAAAKAAQPFGQPPYGLPVELYFAFWTGNAGAADAKAENSSPAGAAKAQGQARQLTAEQNKYLASVTRALRDSMYIPAQTARGTYHVSTRIEVGPDGRITRAQITNGSGDKLLDKYVLQGIHRAGRVRLPPKGLGPALNLDFTLVRQ